MTASASRRAFLQRASALSLAGVATPWAVNLAVIGEAAASTAADYKALVCVFLYGGNDYGNTLVPYDAASYALYQGIRPTLAYARSSLDATALNASVALPDGRQYALAPQLASLLPIWNAGKMAALLNIGTLIQPTSKAQYSAKSVPLPPSSSRTTTSSRSGSRACRRARRRDGAGALATSSSRATATPPSPASTCPVTPSSSPARRPCSTRCRRADRWR